MTPQDLISQTLEHIHEIDANTNLVEDAGLQYLHLKKESVFPTPCFG